MAEQLMKEYSPLKPLLNEETPVAVKLKEVDLLPHKIITG